MAHTIQMTVNASLRDSGLIFRLLNFKEDVHRMLLQGGYGEITDPRSMSRALVPVIITIPRKRHFDHFSEFMNEALRRHNVSDAVHTTVQHS